MKSLHIQVQPRNEFIPRWNASSIVFPSAVTVTSTETTVPRDTAVTKALANTVDLNTRNNTNRQTTLTTSGNNINTTTPPSATATVNVTLNIEGHTTNGDNIKTVNKTNIEGDKTGTTDGVTGPRGINTYIFPAQVLPETANIGTHVYTISATDRDSAHHSNLVYSIESTYTGR